MKFYQLVTLIRETKLSPEQLAPIFGVGSMTIRRWKDERGSKEVPRIYQRSVVEGVYQLLIDDHLDSSSETVAEVLAGCSSLSFAAVLKSLGVTSDATTSDLPQEDKMVIALHQIGVSEQRKKTVDTSTGALKKLKKMGEEWTRRITSLMDILRSHQLSSVDKLVAYGALFYLLCPLDLIPDQVPVVGYVDDFAILGFATTYYLRKFPKLMESDVHA